MKKQYRQGDVFLEETDMRPTTPAVARDAQGRLILAHGEVTGHAHAIVENGATLHEEPQATLLEVTEAMIALRHDEHGAIPLRATTHEVVRQREYTPTAIVNVAD